MRRLGRWTERIVDPLRGREVVLEGRWFEDSLGVRSQSSDRQSCSARFWALLWVRRIWIVPLGTEVEGAGFGVITSQAEAAPKRGDLGKEKGAPAVILPAPLFLCFLLL